jgi:hypothetical protein
MPETGAQLMGIAPIFQPVTQLFLQAATPLAGFPLQNATPTILSWTAPNDGQLHYATFIGSLSVTTLEVGGAVNFQWTSGGQVGSHPIWAAAQATGAVLQPANCYTVAIDPGTTVSVLQSSALTSGQAAVLGAIFGA